MKSGFNKFAISALFVCLLALSGFGKSFPEGEWQLVSYNFQQKIAFPIDRSEITMNIHADGKLGGRSGCNSYGGSYSFEDGKLKIGDLISTMMACDEPSMQFEQRFWKTLQGASVFDLKGGKLTITDEKSGNFLRFERVVKPLLCLPPKN